MFDCLGNYSYKVIIFYYEFFKELLVLAKPILSSYIFWILIILTLSAKKIWLFIKEWRNSNEGWLSALIDESLKKKPSLLIELWKKLIELWNKYKYKKVLILAIRRKMRKCIQKRKIELGNVFIIPSLTSTVFLTIIFVILFYVGHKDLPSLLNIFDSEKLKLFIYQLIDPDPSKDLSHSANIISIIAGLAGIVFAIVIFMAESLDKIQGTTGKSSFLRTTRIWVLITISIFALLNFLWFQATLLSLILPILLAGLIIYSSAQAILHIVSKRNQNKNSLIFLKERIYDVLQDSIRERVGNNILFKIVGLDKEIKAKYTVSKRWIDRDISKYIFINTNSEGYISDINIYELARLMAYLEGQANELEFSIYLDNFKTTGSTSNPNSITLSSDTRDFDQQRNINIKPKPIYILKRYCENLPPNSIFNEGSKEILALPSEFTQLPSVVEEVTNLVSQIFEFSTEETNSYQLRLEFEDYKDEMIKAIKSSSSGTVDRIKKNYLTLAETFLEEINKVGGSYSNEQAKKERSNIFYGWNEVSWLKEDISEFIDIAGTIKNIGIISAISFLPISISIRALQAQDHLLFQDFIRFTLNTYSISINKPAKLKSLIIDRSWRFLSELSKFYIQPKFRDIYTIREEDLDSYKDFIIDVIRLFQDLLKSSFDNRDREGFETFFKAFGEVFSEFHNFENISVENLKYNIPLAKSDKEKAELEERIRIIEKRDSIEEEVKFNKNQIKFGLTAYMLEKFKDNNSDPDIKWFFEKINSLYQPSLEDLTQMFEKSIDFEVENLWGWNMWDLIPDGHVYASDPTAKLYLLFCIKALYTLANRHDQQTIPNSPRLLSSIDQLSKILDNINGNQSNWSFVLDETLFAKIPILKNLLEEAKKQGEKDQMNKLKRSVLDPDKLSEFKKEFLDEIKKVEIIRPLMKELGVYKDLTNENTSNNGVSWGYNQLDEKGVFIKEWHISYPSWGKRYGQGMAQSSNQLVFEEMYNSISNKKDVQVNDLSQQIETALMEQNFTNPIILQTLERIYEYSYIKRSKLFIPSYDKDCPKTKFSDMNGYLGVFKYSKGHIPVFDIFAYKEEMQNKLIIADLERLGEFRQFPPTEKREEIQYKYDIFLIMVNDLNQKHTKRKKLLSQSPDWLQQEQSPDDYLRRYVLVNIYEKFKFEPVDPTAGIAFNILVDDPTT